jgi:hypothetical protein
MDEPACKVYHPPDFPCGTGWVRFNNEPNSTVSTDPLMKPVTLLTVAAVFTSMLSAQAATLSHRYSFNGNTNDTAGGNNGVLLNGATLTATSLSLPGGGSGAGAPNMGFTSPVGIGTNFGVSGVTVESWYTDAGSGNWAKLFTFGSAAVGQEFAFTNARADTGNAAPDRNGAQTFGFRPSIGTEHHLVISVGSSGNMSAWLDGAQVLNNVATNPISNVTTATESIGATAWADPGHFGEVNEFRIWSGELTNAEVAQNFALGPNVIPEPVISALFGTGALMLLRRRRRA